ncbi:MAG: universal stress protein [Ottowia sp.]|nr:universal stress protein [Ottowia sp.]
MFTHIVSPVDGSYGSLAALEKVVAIARAFDSRVTLVYVVDPYPFTGVGTEFAYGQDEYLNAARAEGRAALDLAVQRLEEQGIKPDTRVVESHAIWRGVTDVIDEVGADLVILASHGRRGLERLLLGSVTQSVLAHTHVATLVVRQTPEEASKASADAPGAQA